MKDEGNYKAVKVFTPDLISGVRYGDAVGDYNIIHRDDDEARRLGGKLGIEKAIVAGMGVVARAQDSRSIRKADFKFKVPVCYGAEITLQADGDKYQFLAAGEVIYEGSIQHGDPSGESNPLPRSNLIYDENFHVSRKDVRNYLESTGADKELVRLIETPDLFLMSLSAAALVNHAEKNKKGGFHVRQSMEIHRPWEVGDVKLSIFQKRLRLSAVQKYQTYWSQKELVVASGESIVIPFDLE